MGELTVLLRTLANALNSGKPRARRSLTWPRPHAATGWKGRTGWKGGPGVLEEENDGGGGRCARADATRANGRSSHSAAKSAPPAPHPAPSPRDRRAAASRAAAAAGAPRILQAGAKQIDIPSTHGGADVSVEYEVEDGTHELEIKVAI